MRISRILVQKPLEAGGEILLVDEASHYIRNVLRLKKGFRLTVFDGKGIECPAIVEAFGRDETRLRLGKPLALNLESPLEVHLALGISRGERMDLAIQKAVELGVGQITPLLTEYCVVRLDSEKRELRLQHWERVIQSACEQSGRNRLPRMEAPMAYETWISGLSMLENIVILDPLGEKTLKDLPQNLRQTTLMVGPEGGFSESERKMAMDAGAMPIHLGPRILRTETAVIAGIAAIQALFGDLSENAPSSAVP